MSVATSKERIFLLQVGCGANLIVDKCSNELHFNNVIHDSDYTGSNGLFSNLILRVGIRYLKIYRTYLEANIQNVFGPGSESGYGIGQTIYLIQSNNKLSVDFNLIYPYIPINYSKVSDIFNPEISDAFNVVTVNRFFAIKPILGINWDVNKFFTLNCNINYLYGQYHVYYSGYPKTFEVHTLNTFGMGFKLICNAY